MTKKLLHGPEISPGVEQMRRKCMTERVSGQSGALVDFVQKTLHRILDRSHRNPLPAAAEKKSGSIAARPDTPEKLVPLRLVVAQRELRVVADRNDALFSTLAAHLHLL